jgi:hypothetical protein
MFGREVIGVLEQVLGLVGAVSVVISLLFVGWQTRELAKQTRLNNAIGVTSTFQGSAELMSAVHAPILANPLLRPYFYEGKRCVDGDDQQPLILTVAELMADAAEYGLMAAKQVPGATSWTNYPKFLLAASPSLREVVAEHSDWWPELAGLMASVRPQLQQT